MPDLKYLSYRQSITKAWLNAFRRRFWRYFFRDDQARLGSFFIDPQDHIGSERLVMGESYEDPYLQILDRLADALDLKRGVVIDAGANIGNHSCWFAARFTHVMSVEPGRVSSLILEANLRQSGFSNWEIFNQALGETQGYGNLEVINGGNLGSSKVAKASGDKFDFEIVRGDDIFGNHPIASELPITLMKVDVEGFELDVLKGLKNTIEKHLPLICVEALDEQQWLDVRKFLESCGYVFFIAPVNAHSSNDVLSRLSALFSGKPIKTAEVASQFPTGGYGMIFCLSKRHLSGLTQ